MTDYHPLCPVHGTDGPVELVLTVPDGCVAVAGPYKLVMAFFRERGLDAAGHPAIYARPELPWGSPAQLAVVCARFVPDPDAAPFDFADYGDGTFAIPEGHSIMRNSSGDICIYRHSPPRHTAISSAPISRLN